MNFKALINGIVDRELIKNIFELKMLKYQGEYIDSESLSNKNGTLAYTWERVLVSEPKNLYKFKLKDNVYKLFRDEVNKEFRQKVDKKFKSLQKL